MTNTNTSTPELQNTLQDEIAMSAHHIGNLMIMYQGYIASLEMRGGGYEDEMIDVNYSLKEILLMLRKKQDKLFCKVSFK